MLSTSPSFAELARSYEVNRKPAPRSIADVPKSTPEGAREHVVARVTGDRTDASVTFLAEAAG